MKNLTEYPTPETDQFYSSFADGVAIPNQGEWITLAQNLEQRLAACREALEAFQGQFDCYECSGTAEEALAATEKP